MCGVDWFVGFLVDFFFILLMQGGWGCDRCKRRGSLFEQLPWEKIGLHNSIHFPLAIMLESIKPVWGIKMKEIEWKHI